MKMVEAQAGLGMGVKKLRTNGLFLLGRMTKNDGMWIEADVDFGPCEVLSELHSDLRDRRLALAGLRGRLGTNSFTAERVRRLKSAFSS